MAWHPTIHSHQNGVSYSMWLELVFNGKLPFSIKLSCGWTCSQMTISRSESQVYYHAQGTNAQKFLI